ncbi:MAG: FAD-dependent oxidoreductase [Oscillospiraceae bacterium]|nr:FAD-dependent oxidoreductase [Oscillospiraceae bacterium]
MKYVIIGNSAAAIGAVEGIRQADKQGEILIITNEPYHTYSRPLISYYFSKEKIKTSVKAGDLKLPHTENNSANTAFGGSPMKYRPADFYKDNNCELIHSTAVQIEPKKKKVMLADYSLVPYDRLLVATGSSPFTPPQFENLEKKHNFITLDDAIKLEKSITENSRVLIIGAGLIGLKCAEGILKRVASVTVADIAPRILPAVLEDESAKILQSHLEEKGIVFKLSTEVNNFDEYDIVVVAAGVRPNVELLRGIAEIGKGILINEKSETTAPDIYAAGDCTESLDVSSGEIKIMALLPNAYIQGEAAGVNMAGRDEPKVFDKAIPMNAVGFFGLHVITAGNYNGEVYTANTNKDYKKLFYSDNKLNGYILIGNIEKAGIYTSLIREKTPLDTIDFKLICEKPGLMAFTKEERLIKLEGVS